MPHALSRNKIEHILSPETSVKMLLCDVSLLAWLSWGWLLTVSFQEDPELWSPHSRETYTAAGNLFMQDPDPEISGDPQQVDVMNLSPCATSDSTFSIVFLQQTQKAHLCRKNPPAFYSPLQNVVCNGTCWVWIRKVQKRGEFSVGILKGDGRRVK